MKKLFQKLHGKKVRIEIALYDGASFSDGSGSLGAWHEEGILYFEDDEYIRLVVERKVYGEPNTFMEVEYYINPAYVVCVEVLE